MFTIGEFARLGRVSVRMLRHYDAIGLIRPASVDLRAIESRLRMIEMEGVMPTEDVVLKQVPALRVAELSAVAAGYGPEEISPTIRPLYGQLMARLHASGVNPTGPAIAYYEPEAPETSDSVVVHAGIPVAVGPHDSYDFAVVDLPAVAEAATIVHRGAMDDVMASLAVLGNWIEDNGYRPLGYHREVYIDYDPARAADGVTELQIAIAAG